MFLRNYFNATQMFSFFTLESNLLQYNTVIYLYFCLRSRPGSPNVVRPLVVMLKIVTV